MFALAGLDAVGGVVEHGLISGDDVIVQALVELIHNMTPDVIMVKKKKTLLGNLKATVTCNKF